jgi:hypothetical protein
MCILNLPTFEYAGETRTMYVATIYLCVFAKGFGPKSYPVTDQNLPARWGTLPPANGPRPRTSIYGPNRANLRSEMRTDLWSKMQ